MLRLRALAAALALALAVPARARSSQNQVIAAYRPLRKHPELFDSSAGWRQWIDAALLEAIDTQNMTALQSLMREEVQGVHSFQLFNDEFTQFFLEELDNYRTTGLPINRPNSMNNYVRSDVRCSLPAFAHVTAAVACAVLSFAGNHCEPHRYGSRHHDAAADGPATNR